MSKTNISFIYIFLLLLGSLSSFSLPPYNFIFVNFITYSLFLYLIILFKEKKLKILNFFFLGFTFGYVGSGVGKITLYKGKEVMNFL